MSTFEKELDEFWKNFGERPANRTDEEDEFECSWCGMPTPIDDAVILFGGEAICRDCWERDLEENRIGRTFGKERF